MILGGPAARLGREKPEVSDCLFGSFTGAAGASGGAGQRHPAQPDIPQDASRRAVPSDRRVRRLTEQFGQERERARQVAAVRPRWVSGLGERKGGQDERHRIRPQAAMAGTHRVVSKP